MYENNIDENIIQYNMGHSSVDMTRKYDRRKKKKLDDNTVNNVFGFELPATKAEE